LYANLSLRLNCCSSNVIGWYVISICPSDPWSCSLEQWKDINFSFRVVVKKLYKVKLSFSTNLQIWSMLD
jgi:hypothetical protein